MKLTREEVEKLINKYYFGLKKSHPVYFKKFTDDDLLLRHALTIAYHESRFDKDARNTKSTAKGLFQILDGTHRDIEDRILRVNRAPKSDIFRADYNTYLGVAYFVYQYDHYVNMDKAVIAYNRGSWTDKEKIDLAYLNKHKEYYLLLFPDWAYKEYGMKKKPETKKTTKISKEFK